MKVKELELAKQNSNLLEDSILTGRSPLKSFGQKSTTFSMASTNHGKSINYPTTQFAISNSIRYPGEWCCVAMPPSKTTKVYSFSQTV
jgi:hypothetical protein